MADSELAPKFAPFFSFAGIAAAMIFGSAGAAYGTAKSGIGIAGVGTYRADLIMKVRNHLSQVRCLSSPLLCPVLLQFTVSLSPCSLRKQWAQQPT
ncbi:hypothetical protein VN97_g10236 [Penicillium thymicola]|uniref:V-type proton ATPase proteolipid subunit n=1 Tax=Penicillium thymicola TaxID=293382 RepID=A0AAI9T9R9_PENTH|nr:hypothetical protein VN97_g10236 [Penicillium thymicola]